MYFPSSLRTSTRPRVLDFGCGPGYLLRWLLAAGVTCEGVDFSSASVSRVVETLASDPKFRGVTVVEGLPTPLSGDAYDVVFLVETVEHLLDDDLGATLEEVHRLCRPGGVVVVTTPHLEDLDRTFVICPDCGGMYHPMQHVRSWSAETLTSTMAERGFDLQSCNAIHLTRNKLASHLRAAAARLLRRKMPHLVYIGVKPVNSTRGPS